MNEANMLHVPVKPPRHLWAHARIVTFAPKVQIIDRKAMLNRLRVAHHTLRQDACIACAMIEYDGHVIDGLISVGYLVEADAKDQRAINHALSLFLADAFHADALKKFLLMHEAGLPRLGVG
jgi:hypothetical protein